MPFNAPARKVVAVAHVKNEALLFIEQVGVDLFYLAWFHGRDNISNCHRSPYSLW